MLEGENANTSSFNFALLIFNKINYKYLIGSWNLVHGKLLAQLMLPQSVNLLCLSTTACGCNFATLLSTSNKKKQTEMLKPIARESYYEEFASLLWAVGSAYLVDFFFFFKCTRLSNSLYLIGKENTGSAKDTSHSMGSTFDLILKAYARKREQTMRCFVQLMHLSRSGHNIER